MIQKTSVELYARKEGSVIVMSLHDHQRHNTEYAHTKEAKTWLKLAGMNKAIQKGQLRFHSNIIARDYFKLKPNIVIFLQCINSTILKVVVKLGDTVYFFKNKDVATAEEAPQPPINLPMYVLQTCYCCKL